MTAVQKNKMEAPGRVELPTNGLGNRCSIHLSYGAINLSIEVLRLGRRSGLAQDFACGLPLTASRIPHARKTAQFRKPLLYPSELQGRGRRLIISFQAVINVAGAPTNRREQVPRTKRLPLC